MVTNNTISRINGKRGANSPNSYTNIIHVFSQEITQPKGRISYLRTHITCPLQLLHFQAHQSQTLALDSFFDDIELEIKLEPSSYLFLVHVGTIT